MLGAKSNKENAKSYHERNKTHNIFIRLLFRLFLCSTVKKNGILRALKEAT